MVGVVELARVLAVELLGELLLRMDLQWQRLGNGQDLRILLVESRLDAVGSPYLWQEGQVGAVLVKDGLADEAVYVRIEVVLQLLAGREDIGRVLGIGARPDFGILLGGVGLEVGVGRGGGKAGGEGGVALLAPGVVVRVALELDEGGHCAGGTVYAFCYLRGSWSGKDLSSRSTTYKGGLFDGTW